MAETALPWLNKTVPLAGIFSLSGQNLTNVERELFESANPLGFILFKRNIDNPLQLRSLIEDLRKCVGRHCPVLIDQEGGRVSRLAEPIWDRQPPAAYFGDLTNGNSALGEKELSASLRKTAYDLSMVGIDVNCSPVLDIRFPETHDAIGDRAFASHPDLVEKCGDIVCREYLKNGITPVIKHMPGHGRAQIDSHLDLPVIKASLEDLKETDFKPFQRLAGKNYADKLWGMTAHILLLDIDPDFPASASKKITKDIIRGEIGFKGFLLSDDIDMKGLVNVGPDFADVDKRALAALHAGSDAVLYCSGHLVDMKKLTEALPPLSDEALGRLKACQT